MTDTPSSPPPTTPVNEPISPAKSEEMNTAVAYHSSGDKPSIHHTNVYSHLGDFARMRKMDDPNIFLHRVIDDIIGREADLFTEFMGNVGNDARALEQIVDSLSLLFRESVGRGLSPAEVLEDLQIAGVDDKYARAVAEACYSRQEEIRESLIEGLPRLSGFELLDFDWKVVVAMASDQLATLREPLIQLDLTLGNADGVKRNVTMEVTRDQFDDFMAKIESANEIILKMSPINE